MRKAEIKYSKVKYPHYLPWSKLVHVIQVGTLLKKDGKVYRVKQVLKSQSYSICPKLYLEEVEDV